MTTILGGECHQHTYYRVTILYVITNVITSEEIGDRREELGDRSEFREIREFRDIREFSEEH